MRPQGLSLLDALVSGEVTARDLAGLSADDIAHLTNLGRSAFEMGDHQRARLVFQALETLESDRPAHALRTAAAEHSLGLDENALASIHRYLKTDTPRNREQLDAALSLRARLLLKHDPEAGARAEEICGMFRTFARTR